MDNNWQENGDGTVTYVGCGTDELEHGTIAIGGKPRDCEDCPYRGGDACCGEVV